MRLLLPLKVDQGARLVLIRDADGHIVAERNFSRTLLLVDRIKELVRLANSAAALEEENKRLKEKLASRYPLGVKDGQPTT